MADAGYGSENNYRYLKDEFPQHTGLIHYATMLKEKSKKWKTDERKVMNWVYYEEEDFYIDPKGVQFKFHVYRQKKDKDGVVKDVKEYRSTIKQNKGNYFLHLGPGRSIAEERLM